MPIGTSGLISFERAITQPSLLDNIPIGLSSNLGLKTLSHEA